MKIIDKNGYEREIDYASCKCQYCNKEITRSARQGVKVSCFECKNQKKKEYYLAHKLPVDKKSAIITP
jgi:hypothetical protein